MCYYQRCSVFHHFFQCILNISFRLCIQRRSCFVENHNWWIFKNRSCDGNPLFLSAGKFVPIVPNIGIITFWETFYELMGIGNFRGFDNFFSRSILFAHCNIVVNRIIEKNRFLRYHSQKRAIIF